jgi:hypothetical protein
MMQRLHCWSIILRFCRLTDRIQCSYVNKFINSKYQIIQPSVNDLMAEIEFLYEQKIEGLGLQKLNRSDKSYLNSFMDLKPFNFSIGLHNNDEFLWECDHIDISDEGENTINRKDNSDIFNENLLPMMEKIVETKNDWKPIFGRSAEEESFYFVLNHNNKSKYYNKVVLFYPNGSSETFRSNVQRMQSESCICNLHSFLNNFPILFAKRSSIIIPQDSYRSWKDHISILWAEFGRSLYKI